MDLRLAWEALVARAIALQVPSEGLLASLRILAHRALTA